MKKLFFVLCFVMLFAVVIDNYVTTIQADFEENLLRLHVIANSDSQEDQELKLKVRDRIIQETGHLFQNTQDATESERILMQNLHTIEQIANDELIKNHSNQRARVEFGNFPFPTKTYGEVSLPAGQYRALRVVLGNGNGKNWWCVMFPPLCFVGVESPQMPKQSREILEDNLTKEEYDLITKSDEQGVNIKFKLVELWQEGKEFLKNLK